MSSQNANRKTEISRRDDPGDNRSTDVRDSRMMAHLLDALEDGADIGHYGRLVFVMVARHFLRDDEIVRLIAGQPGMDESQARVMLAQVQEKDYNPPRRERILEWQQQQDFQICPEEDDPAGCNVYRELRFPEQIYDNIEGFWAEKVENEE